MAAGSLRSLGLLPMANFMGLFLPLRFTCVFLTVAVLSINWAGVICDRVVLSKFLEVVSTSAERNLFKQSDTIAARFGHEACGPVGNVVVLCIR